ncbi:MAG: histidine kinase famiy protein [Burkholderiaceae bacterium]
MPASETQRHCHTTAPADDALGERDIFFAAIEKTRMPMIVTDPRKPDNPVVFANPAFLQMTGYELEEVVGNNCRFLQGPETDPATVAEMRKAIAERRDVALEILNYRKNGSTFWNALFVSPVFDANGELVYFFGSQLDVSRRRDAEEALGQAQKMEALGQLTGGIAHDFNNLLQVMAGYLEMMDLSLKAPNPDRGQLRRNVDSVRSAVTKASVLTQRLLAFARRQRLYGRTLNLNSLTENLAELARQTLGSEITVRTEPAPQLWNCQVDPTQVEVALLNVLLNARDAMPGGGLLTLRTRNEVIGEEDLQAFPGLRPGRHVSIAVTDTGTGIAPELLNRVMDPFFTTKEEGKGTGLGLSMVYGFAKQSGGAVYLYSEVGVGTTVRLYFPATDSAVPAPLPAAAVKAEAGDGETILVVDDRLEVAELAQTMLESLGYRSIVVTSPDGALKVLQGTGGIALLFSDLIMPGDMNGVMLAREAKRRHPDLRVLLTTGYADPALERNETGHAEFDIINKPYRREELARRVKAVLAGQSGRN